VAGKDFKANGVGHAFDDFDAPAAEFGECLKELIAGIGTVGEKVAQPEEEIVDGFDMRAISWRSADNSHHHITSAMWSVGNHQSPAPSKPDYWR
jgi:hypothetical protein